MTSENQNFGHRGSFVDHGVIDDKTVEKQGYALWPGSRLNHMGESDKQLERHLGIQQNS